MRIFPVLCARSLHNIGTDLILNFIVDNLPAPTEREGFPRDERWRAGHAEDRRNRPLLPVRFQDHGRPVCRTHHVLQSRYRRGQKRRQPAEFTRGTAERLAHMASPQGKTLQPVTELHAGDIGAVAKLKDYAHRRHASG